jgi:putative hemolysin
MQLCKSVGSVSALLLAFGCLTAAPALADNNDVYCIKHGGKVVERIPVYGTNGNHPLILSGSAKFCTFTDNDKSQIFVLTSTLATKMPTLAALAYYAKPAVEKCRTGPSANPSFCYCEQLGGTASFGGINMAGGGWVLKKDLHDVVSACIFPDLSSIDTWGLTYHANGIIRGIDLSKVLAYPDPYPPAKKDGAAAKPASLPY